MKLIKKVEFTCCRTIRFIVAVLIATWLLWLGSDISIYEIYKICPIYNVIFSLGKIFIKISPYMFIFLFLGLFFIILVEGLGLKVLSRVEKFFKRLYLKNEIFILKNWGFAVVSILTIIFISIIISLIKVWLYTLILLWLSLLMKFWLYHNNPQQFKLDLIKLLNLSSFIVLFLFIFGLIPSLILYIQNPLYFQILCKDVLLFRYSFLQSIVIFLVCIIFYKPNTKENRIKIYNIISTYLICGLSLIVIIEFFKQILVGPYILENIDPNSDETLTIKVSTTLPVIEGNVPSSIISDRIILRRLVLSDLEAHHSLRGQPEAMAHSRRGKPDANLDETLAHLKRMSDTYFGIFLKNSDGTEGELIGDGGVHKFVSEKTGWPEFGYKFKKEYWGQGYATEFANAFMGFWLNLPRIDTHIVVASSSVIICEDTSHVVELVCAWTTEDNLASQNVLKKVGFKSFQGMDNGYVNWRKTFEKLSFNTCQSICSEYFEFKKYKSSLKL